METNQRGPGTEPAPSPLVAFAEEHGLAVSAPLRRALAIRGIQTVADFCRLYGVTAPESNRVVLDKLAFLEHICRGGSEELPAAAPSGRTVHTAAALMPGPARSTASARAESQAHAFLAANAMARRRLAREPESLHTALAGGLEDCQCEDCESAVSPLAYLADLIDYAQKHVKNGGAPIDLNFLTSNFAQPFAALPTACGELSKQVRQVRICIEVLRSYLRGRDVPPSFRAAEARYLLAAYTTLLLRLGVPYDEIRLARGASPSARKALADRLQIDPAHLGSLFLDPNAVPPMLTEQALEQLFGLADTTADPFAARPVPSLQTRRAEYLRAQWRSQDWPPDMPAGDRPFIDPDLVGPDDFRTQAAKANPGDPDGAFDIWLRRRNWADARLQALSALTRIVAGQAVPDFEAMLASLYQPVTYGAAARTPWVGAPAAGDLGALREKLARGIDMAASVATVEQQLNITVDAFMRLMDLRARDALAAQDVRNPALTPAEWQEVRSILVQAQKGAFFPEWHAEEQAVAFGPKAFWISLREPAEGDWPPVLPQGVPLIDPETVRLLDLPEHGVGQRAEGLWQARRDSLVQIRAALAAEHGSNGFDAMLRLALGSPAPGGPLQHDPVQLLDDLSSLDNTVVSSASTRIEQDFRLTPEDFRRIMTVRAKDGQADPLKRPTAAEYAEVYALLTAARKLKHEYPLWAQAEQAAATGVVYWAALKARLPRWRAGAEARRQWQDALRQHMQAPIIDPDLVSETDLKDATPGNAAYDLWKLRRDWVENQIGALRAARGGAGGYSQIVHTALGISLTGLVALGARRDAGENITGRLGQLGLSLEALNYLLRIRDMETTGGPVLASEWEEVYSILAQSLKRREFAAWREAEKPSVTLSPDLFRIPTAAESAAVSLPAWRTASDDRWEWQNRLQARIEQDQAAISALQEAVSATEEAVLPMLRDALVDAAGPGGVDLSVKAKQLTDRLLIDTQAGGCQMTTRIAQAMETLQGLLWSVRSHQLEDTHPNLALAAPNFDEEWEWLGSYSTWRAAMFVFTYPENILLPSLRPRQTPAFRTLLNALRENRRLTPEQACEAGQQYAAYFRDVCSLGAPVCCTARTHIPGSNCRARSVEGYKDLTYYFALSQTKRLYWSTLDSSDPSGNGQSFWEALAGVENALAIVGAAIYRSYLYLFVRTQKEDAQKLLFLRYSLEHRHWDGTPVELELPENATQFTARLKVTDANTPPILGIWLPNGAGYSRGLNGKADGWEDADFKRIFVTGGWRHLSPEPGHGLGADLDGYGGPIPAKFAVVGDFNGDGKDELAIAPDVGGTEGNDFWVYTFDSAAGVWQHLVPNNGHGFDADLDCSSHPYGARFALAGDLNGDGRDELIVAIDAPDDSGRNDFWVMSFDPAAGTWNHLWAGAAGHPLEADLDCTGAAVGAKFAVVGDFNGDGRDEIAIAVDKPGTEGNDFWVYGFKDGDWYSLGPSYGDHNYHVDCSAANVAARWGVAADLNGDGRDELIVAIADGDSGGNDFWVMNFDPAADTWNHLYHGAAGHPLEADLDCSEADVRARFAVTGDFNGDGKDEIIIAAAGWDSQGNDFWAYGFHAGEWYGLGPSGGPFNAHLDASGSNFPARFAVAGDFDGDGKDEIGICPWAPGSLGNDFWVYFFDAPTGTWEHLSRMPWHHLDASFDCSGAEVPARWAVTGDFNGDGSAEIAAVADAPESGGNDFWIMHFDALPVEWPAPCPTPISAIAPQYGGPFTLPAKLTDWELDTRKDQIRAAFLQNQGASRTSLICLEEFWYFVPLQIALQLQQRGHYTAALDWYRTIYDYSRRTKIYYGLEREESAGGTYNRPSDWLLDPLNPHGIASARQEAYTRFTLLSVVRCFLEYADAEFTRDTAESLPRARTLYVTALELLDLPALQDACGSLETVGVREVAATAVAAERTLGDLLAEKRELLALSRAVALTEPAALEAALRASTAMAEGDAALPALSGAWTPSLAYTFCIPPNPMPSWLRLRAGINLTKLRNCRNIAGMQRQVDLYAAPTDAVTGLPGIGAGGQLLLPGLRTLQPTPYRYATMIERAKQLVQLAGQVEAAMLAALEKQDAESYTLLKARQDVDMARAGVRLQDLRVREAEGGVKLAQLQQDRAQLQFSHYEKLLADGLLGSEQASLDLMIAASALYSVAALINITAAAASFFPAPGVSATAAERVNMLSQASLASAQATSAWAQLFGTWASYERRVQEWEFSRSLAAQDIQIGAQQVRIAEDHVRVVSQERQIADLQVDHAKATVDFLANKFTNAELYHWMTGVLQQVYSYFLQQATAVAQLAAAQLAFERQETPPPFIRADYWEAPDEMMLLGDRGPDRRGLTGSARLLQDIYQLDQYAFETNKRKLQLSRTISLARLDPFAFQRLRETGAMRFATPMSLFDRDYPGHYLRLIRRVRSTVIALVPPSQGLRATLSNTGTSRVVIGGDLFQTVKVRRDPETVALSGASDATGVLEMDPQAEMLLPFEGLGVDTAWELQLPRAANPFDYSTIADVLLTVEYTALNDYTYRAQVLSSLPATVSSQRSYSFRYQMADQWYDLNNPAQSATPMTVRFTTRRSDFPPNLEHLRMTNLLLYFVRKGGRRFEVPVRHLLCTEAGSSGTVGGAAESLEGLIRAAGGTGGSWIPMLGKSPVGEWELALADTPEVRGRFQQGDIEDILLVITYSGRTPAYP